MCVTFCISIILYLSVKFKKGKGVKTACHKLPICYMFQLEVWVD